MAIFEAARDAKFIVVSQSPDVCKTPPYGTPVPYQIVAFSTDTIKQSQNVNFKGNKAKTMASRITRVTGDEPGVMGGVMSGVNMGFCKPVPMKHSTSFRVNGEWVLFDKQTLWWMNCAGPEGTGNTIGRTIFLGASMPAAMGPDGPPPGDPELLPETDAEQSFFDKAFSAEGISSMADMAPQLASMDWSNPAGALGALGGMAGIGGFSQMAGLAGMASQAAGMIQDPSKALGLLGPIGKLVRVPAGQIASLVTADFSNPGSIVSSAGNLAGMSGLLAGYGEPQGDPQLKSLIPGCPEYEPTQSDTDDGWCRDTTNEWLGGHGGKPQYRSYGTNTTGGQQCVYDPVTGQLDTGKDAGTIDKYGTAVGENDDGSCDTDVVAVNMILHQTEEVAPYHYDQKEYDAKQDMLRNLGVPSGTVADPKGPYAKGISDDDLNKEHKRVDSEWEKKNSSEGGGGAW